MSGTVNDSPDRQSRPGRVSRPAGMTRLRTRHDSPRHLRLTFVPATGTAGATDVRQPLKSSRLRADHEGMPIHLADPTPAVAPDLIASLLPLTQQARAALRSGEVQILELPFKVGCESRKVSATLWRGIERRLSRVPHLNDIYLVEQPGPTFGQISREHFLIQAHGDKLYLVDRGSRHGTQMDDRRIGGDCLGGRTELVNGGVILIGAPSSPYIFRFHLAQKAQRSAA